jgi:dihydroorotase
LENLSITTDAAASLTLFLPSEQWTVKTLQTKSANTPFIGRELTGKAIGIINKDKLFLNEY